MLNFGHATSELQAEKREYNEDIQLLENIVSLEKILSKISVQKSKLDFGFATENLIAISKEDLKTFDMTKNELRDRFLDLSEFFKQKEKTVKRVKVSASLASRLRKISNVTISVDKDNTVSVHECYSSAASMAHITSHMPAPSRLKLQLMRINFVVLKSVKSLLKTKDKYENQKIVPPSRKAGKFKAEKNDHTHMVNGPMKITGMP